MSKTAAIKRKQADSSQVSALWMKFIFVGLVLLLYGKTINYEFVLDDGLIIENNPVVQKGAAGMFETFSQGSVTHFKGSNFQIYRPALISFLCLENQVFGMTPSGFHFMNLVLYSLLAIVVFNLLALMFPKLHFYYRTLITVIFIAHPIHAEVVANVKSQDELLATLGCLLALQQFIMAYDFPAFRKKHIILGVLAFLPALFSKESSFAFVIVFPLFLFLFRSENVLNSLRRSAAFFAAAVFFLGCRYLAIRDINVPYETSPIENVLYAAKTTGEQIGTKLEIAFYYIRMMVFPYPMSWDYSFNQIPVLPLAHAIPILSILLYAFLAFLFFGNIRRQPAVSFGIAFFTALSVPTASLFFPNGTTFADRFLFMPSLGFIIAIVYLAAEKMKAGPDELNPSAKKVVGMAGLVIAVLCCGLTMSRASDWKDNFAVFSSGARNSPNSSRTNEGLGTIYMNQAQEGGDPALAKTYVDSAIFFMQKSLDIFPGNNSAAYKLAMIYHMTGQKDKAMDFYRQSIRAKPDYVMALINLGTLFASASNYDSAYYYFKQAIRAEPGNGMALTNYIIASYNLGKLQETVEFGEKAVSLGEGNAKVYNILSLSYGRLGDTAKAARYRALHDANPNAN